MCEGRDLTGAESKKSTGAFFEIEIMSFDEISSWDDQDTNKKELV